MRRGERLHIPLQCPAFYDHKGGGTIERLDVTSLVIIQLGAHTHTAAANLGALHTSHHHHLKAFSLSSLICVNLSIPTSSICLQNCCQHQHQHRVCISRAHIAKLVSPRIYPLLYCLIKYFHRYSRKYSSPPPK